MCLYAFLGRKPSAVDPITFPERPLDVGTTQQSIFSRHETKETLPLAQPNQHFL